MTSLTELVTGKPRTITVELPDGRELDVEADSPEAAAKAAKSFLDREGAAKRVSEEGQAHPTFMGIDNAVRSVARGVPLIGGAADEVSAGLNTGFGYLGDYDKELAYQRERDRQYDEAHPYLSTAGQVGGAILGTAAAGRYMPGSMVPASMAGRIAGAAGTGTALGAVEGFTRGEGGAEQRLQEALPSAVSGAAFGAISPPIARGIGAAWNGIASALANRGIDAKSVSKILSELQGSGMSPQQAEQRLQQLGPEGMVADVNPGMQQMAGATGISDPGAARTIGGRLAARRDAGRGRVAQSLDNAFGPARDPYAVQQASAAQRAAQGGSYEQALSNAPQLPQGMGDLLARQLTEPAKGMTQQNRQLMGGLMSQIDDALAADTPELTARRLHDLRKTLDAQIVRDRRAFDMLSSTDKAQQGVLQQVRGTVDDILKNRVPGFQEADAAFAPIARQQAAYEQGRTQVLKGGPNTMTPEQLRALQAQSSAPENAMRQQGVRTELDRIMSNQRRDPAVAIDAVTTRDWNDRKLQTMIGPQRAGRLASDLDREGTFTQTSNLAEASRNSRTAPLMATAQRVWGGNGGAMSDALAAGGTGTLLGGPGAGAAAAAGVGLNSVMRRIANKLTSSSPEVIRRTADMITETGANRDAVIRLLVNQANAIPARSAQADRIQRLIGQLLVTQSGRLGYEAQSAFSGRAGR